MAWRNSMILVGFISALFFFQNCGDSKSFNTNNSGAQDSQGDSQGNPDAGDPGANEGDGGLPSDPNDNPGTPGNPGTNNPGVPPGGSVIRLPDLLGDYASIAFEDNVNQPNAGDRDYNDAVFNYKIEEIYNMNNQLTQIRVEVRVRAKISGNNHRLFLYLNGNPVGDFSNITHVSQAAIQGSANIKVTEPDGDVTNLQNVDSLIVVPSTRGAVGDVYQLEINLLNPELNQVAMVPSAIDFKKYRFVLQNHGQNLGIDISEINSTDEMVANDGYPLGFMIPTNWDPPNEGQLIDNKYPKFQLYRSWLNGNQNTPLSDNARYWFL